MKLAHAAAAAPALFLAQPAFAQANAYSPTQDLLWIAIMGGLLAATLAYVRLLDKA